MFTIALVGPDGAGKTTIGQRLLAELQLPIKYVYLGINVEASNVMLPTTRLIVAFKRARGQKLNMGGPRDPSKRKVFPKNPLKRVAYELKAGLRMLNQLAEEWYRQGVVWYYLWRGYIVLFDRHYLFDYYYHDVVANGEERSLASRIHGWQLAHFYPRPDLVIFLDAPAETLFARKGEGSVALIEQRRQEYLQMRPLFDNFVTIDVTQAQEKVLQDALAIVQNFR
jgi:thymidylate kinase